MAGFTPYQPYPQPSPASAAIEGPPLVLVAVPDATKQRRLTVAFRLLLVIPHGIVLLFLAIGAAVVLFLGWWGALFTGRLPQFAASYLSGYLGWYSRVFGYGVLLTDAYPRFTMQDDPQYPVRIAFPPAQRLNRFAVFFRLILVIPADILGTALTYGAFTIVSFIAWLIVLVTGRLPVTLHQAYSAAFRYTVRLTAYLYLLTPAQPWHGLFGDAPGTPTWADAAAGVGPGVAEPQDQPGFGTPESVYGTTAGYGATTGYGAPAGYGVPGEYAEAGGYPEGAAARPSSWLLVLSKDAKVLLGVLMALGAVLYAISMVLNVSAQRSALNPVTALNQVGAAHQQLASELNQVESAVTACNKNLTCVTGQDGKAAADFSTFAGDLSTAPVPGSAAAAQSRLQLDARAAVNAFTQLSQATTVAQYQSAYTSSGLAQALTNFDSDYSALVSQLEQAVSA